MISDESEHLVSALRKLMTYSTARDRQRDKEPRTITLTDDEGFAILTALQLTTGAVSWAEAVRRHEHD